MLIVEYDLCELKEKENCGLCSPIMVVKEDTSDDSCPIVLPEYMPIGEATELAELLKQKILIEFDTVAEFREEVYEKNESGD